MDTNLERCIEDVHAKFSSIYLGAIPQLLNNEGAYMSFICVCSSIEALAGYRHPDEKYNGPRFKKFVTEYFSPPYTSWANELWTFRNNMVHAFNPGNDFMLVHHQSQNHFLKTKTGHTILNAEDFYAALLAATQVYFQDLRSREPLQNLFQKRISDPNGGLLYVGPVILDSQ